MNLPLAIIRPNYLSTVGDRMVAAKLVRHGRWLMEAAAIRKYRPQEMQKQRDGAVLRFR
ncbi:hypothetical protein [Rhizobium bangladeshense]|uniref:hypothetical protein n=1 Tax=Rhizobium bangladeshense TaxID=1138189 RepID=UPI001C83F457|nr:hypothetical protein [Rhizobium bangladeshense]MBX4892175.1 hypothetical protein [Rhizobium bangladeshense]